MFTNERVFALWRTQFVCGLCVAVARRTHQQKVLLPAQFLVFAARAPQLQGEPSTLAVSFFANL
jgi:hypothetical protein